MKSSYTSAIIAVSNEGILNGCSVYTDVIHPAAGEKEGAVLCGDTLVKLFQLSCGLRVLQSPFHKRYLFPVVKFLRIVPSPLL